jgi:general secretion pathway protein E
MRVLDRQQLSDELKGITLERLGFDADTLARVRRLSREPYGMFLVTGPTGSGKTTTLYGCLQALNDSELSITTIEQPVEKHFEDALQMEVHTEGSLTFETALKSNLRHDPDVIMIGEIRDRQSAAIAVQAAITGHQVLSTIHANDAVGVLDRMTLSFGIDRAAFAQALKLSIAQRLVRRLCPQCRETGPASHEDMRGFPDIDVAAPVISRRVGCPSCSGTGFAGRIAIMELFPVDSQMTALIIADATPATLRLENAKRGYTSLLHQATRLAFTGEIALTEARAFLASTSI